MEISITIKNAHVDELIDVYGKNYETTIEDENGNIIPNPLTKTQFAKKTFKKEWRNSVKRRVQNHRRELANEALSNIDITE